MQKLTDNQQISVVFIFFLCVCHSENVPEDEDDLYAAVYGLEDDYAGGEIYEDLMRTEQLPPLVPQLVSAHTHTSQTPHKTLNTFNSHVE